MGSQASTLAPYLCYLCLFEHECKERGDTRTLTDIPILKRAKTEYANLQRLERTTAERCV